MGVRSKTKAATPSNTESVPTPARTEHDILESPNLKNFTYKALKTATRNFRPQNMVGEGGFGYVYRGWVDEQTLAATDPGSGMMVAIKELNPDGFQGHREWLTEINYLGQLHHPNLVKLIGFCLEDVHRLLVYEFMSHGSMENHLFKRGSNFEPLSWDLRMQIALDAAKGLTFLHNTKPKPIIYRDFKTSNLLLDSSYNAKLSDFGLARDGPNDDESHVSTRVMGTDGYAAPEYLETGHLTVKSDVYSFGVVLLEMLSGKPGLDRNRPSGQHKLVDWARPYLSNKNKILHVMDTRLDGGQYPKDQARKAANLARKCIRLKARARPTMDKVVESLEKLWCADNSRGSLMGILTCVMTKDE